jgi:hypothetical protein
MYAAEKNDRSETNLANIGKGSVDSTAVKMTSTRPTRLARATSPIASA